MTVTEVNFRRNRDPLNIAEESLAVAQQAVADGQWYEDQWLLAR